MAVHLCLCPLVACRGTSRPVFLLVSMELIWRGLPKRHTWHVPDVWLALSRCRIAVALVMIVYAQLLASFDYWHRIALHCIALHCIPNETAGIVARLIAAFSADETIMLQQPQAEIMAAHAGLNVSTAGLDECGLLQ